MTSRGDLWAKDRTKGDAWAVGEVRAFDVGMMIADAPVTWNATRYGASLGPQTVRIDDYKEVFRQAGVNEETTLRRAVLLGYRNYPGVTNTNVQGGDRGLYRGVMYEVVDLILDDDAMCVQAVLEVRP